MVVGKITCRVDKVTIERNTLDLKQWILSLMLVHTKLYATFNSFFQDKHHCSSAQFFFLLFSKSVVIASKHDLIEVA